MSASLLLGITAAHGQMSVGPWIPIFKGVSRAVGTNYPNASNTTNQAVNCVKVDLTDPDVQILTTPPAPGYVTNSNETISLSVSNFLRNNLLKVAVDANFYRVNDNGWKSDPRYEGLPAKVFGLQICTGAVVSVADTSDTEPRYASILFTTNKVPSFNLNNTGTTASNIAGIYNAVTGYYPLLTNGNNVWALYSNQIYAAYPDSTIHGLQPRTAIGVSQDRKTLFLLILDGRQGGYSDGAYDSETGLWLLKFGAWDAISMDGGNSSSMYMANPSGAPLPLGHSSAVASYGRERYIGSHFGVSAKTLSGFVNDISVVPGSTTAIINWTTISNSSSRVQYGLSWSFGTYSTLDSTLVTNHSITLGGLAPATTYYFQVISSPDGVSNYTGTGIFSTTNLPNGGSGVVFNVTNAWRWSGANYDAVPTWKSPSFVDSSWVSGPGLLWADNRGKGWCADCVPQNTQMDLDPSTGSVYPYPTYYFRTHFRFTNNPVGATLTFSNFVEDGGIFYLNGSELFRIRMPASGVSNATFSTTFPCANNYPSGHPCRGVATTNCPDVIPVSGDLLTNLIQGDNVLAVEVHNQRANSPDINFGAALYYSLPAPTPPASPFLTNVLATAGETNATITWNTLSNSSSQVQYGLTSSMGAFTTLDSTLVTNHSVTLTGLLRTNLYYFQVISTLGATQYTATGSFFTAPFYQSIIPLTDNWSFTSNNLDGVNWRSANFIDSGWLDGVALLWVDESPTPNPLVQPRNSQLPANETTHLPWNTYYFRNHFTISNLPPPGFSLVFSNFINDGAVFYMNGKEIQRLRLPAAPTVITNGTVATATNSAVTADVFRLWCQRAVKTSHEWANQTQPF